MRSTFLPMPFLLSSFFLKKRSSVLVFIVFALILFLNRAFFSTHNLNYVNSSPCLRSMCYEQFGSFKGINPGAGGMVTGDVKNTTSKKDLVVSKGVLWNALLGLALLIL